VKQLLTKVNKIKISFKTNLFGEMAELVDCV
jgi:hypothetical protein